MEVVLGMDIGGTNTDIAMVSKSGQIIERAHMPTGNYEQFDDYAEAIKKLVHNMNLKHDFSLEAFGIGAPNGNFYSGMIEFAPNLSWKGKVNVVQTMQDKLGIPTFITNDANAAAIGEMKFGVAGVFKHFVMITLGTGVGSGVVVNGELVYGHDGFAGEVGHMISTENGRQCGCGRLGCLETYSSVTGLMKSVFDMHNVEGRAGILADLPLEELTGKKIEQAALLDDAVAKDAFEIAGKELGKVLAGVTAVTSPEAFVLFGGMANAGDLIFEPVKRNMEDQLLPIYRNKIAIVPSGLKGNEAAILGAAALAWNELSRL
jgi:glucokinase